MREYTVHDIINAECNLEPLVCLYCGSHEVVFQQYVGDASCQECGIWQLEGLCPECGGELHNVSPVGYVPVYECLECDYTTNQFNRRI